MSAVMPENLCGQMELEPALLFGAASFPERATVKRRLQRDVGTAVLLMCRQMDSLAKQLISCRSKEEFCALRQEIFPKYLNASFAVGSMMKSVMTNVDHVEIVQEALASIMKFFKSEGAAYLGSDGRAEVIFCLSTLRKAVSMVRYILSKKIAPESKEADSGLARQFAMQVIFFQLNLECLRLALTSEDSLNPEVLTEIVEGLRASVMAYAAARQAMELRGFSEKRYLEAPDASWDEEDEELARF